MGSLLDGSQVSRDAIVLESVIPKPEPPVDAGSCSSSVSTPEADGDVIAQDSAQRQKRKGGRKPVRVP